MQDHICRRLEAILKSPDGWGPPHAVELQVILLVEMWHVVRAASREQVDNTTRRFAGFLGSVLPGPPTPLAVRLGLTDTATEQFVAVLREFIHHESVDLAGANPTTPA